MDPSAGKAKLEASPESDDTAPMRRITPLLRVGLVALLVLPATTSCDKLSALARKVRGNGTSPEATPVAVAPGERLPGGKVHHILENDFDRLVADPERLVMVDFYADWCGPCRALAPTLVTLAGENPEKLLILKVNVDHARALAGRVGVRGIPDIRFFRGGKQIDTMVGAAPLDDMRRIVQAHLPAKAPAPASPAPSPATSGPLGMVDKLKQAMTKKDGEATSQPPPNSPSTAPSAPAAPPQPAIQPVKKNDEWMPQGMSKGKPPGTP